MFQSVKALQQFKGQKIWTPQETKNTVHQHELRYIELLEEIKFKSKEYTKNLVCPRAHVQQKEIEDKYKLLTWDKTTLQYHSQNTSLLSGSRIVKASVASSVLVL